MPTATSPPPGEKIESRAQIVNFPSIIGQPFAGEPDHRFTFGALKKIAVVLGVTACDKLPLGSSRQHIDRSAAHSVVARQAKLSMSEKFGLVLTPISDLITWRKANLYKKTINIS